MSANYATSALRWLWNCVAALPRRIVRAEISPVAQQLSQQMHDMAAAMATVQRGMTRDAIREELNAAIHTFTAEMTIQLSAYYQDLRINSAPGKSDVLIKLENLERTVTALVQRIDTLDKGYIAPSHRSKGTTVAR